MSLTQEDLKKLSAPFPKEKLGVKVQMTSKDKTKAMLVLYLSHHDVYERIEEIDPSWSCFVTYQEQIRDIFVVRMAIEIKGIKRENTGDGDTPKSALSDALKRTAMLFGVGRSLYDSEQVWIPYNEQTDRYKQFTMEDYEKALKPKAKPTPTNTPLPQPHVPTTPMAQRLATTGSTKPKIQVGKPMPKEDKPPHWTQDETPIEESPFL